MIAEIELAPEELEFLTKHLEVSDPNEALRKATDEYIRYRKRMNLIEFNEDIDIDFDAVPKMDQIECGLS